MSSTDTTEPTGADDASTATSTEVAASTAAADHHDDHHHHAAPAAAADGRLYGVLAEFRSPGDLKHAAKQVRDAGYTDFDCYSPFPVHGIDDAMGIKRTILPLIVFAGGCAGLLGGIFLQWWMNAYDWPILISGKPTWSLPANIPIAFETTILLSVLTTFFGMWTLNKLPQVWHPFFRLDRFAKVTDDGFMLGIEAKDARFDLARTTQLLKDAGALEVENCHLDPDPAKKTMPSWITAFIICTTALALVPFAMIAKARASKSTEPHYHVFEGMDFQPKVKADAPSAVFADGRGNRGAIPGTIARGSLHADDAFYRGLETVAAAPAVPPPAPATPAVGGVAPPAEPLPPAAPVAAWLTGLPAQVEVTPDLLKRGKERYGIFCAPCHGYDGRGNGTVRKRADLIGTPLLAANMVDPAGGRPLLPNGQLFNVISNGVGTMAGYAAQIPHADRWAIVLYVRALQRAQNASPADAGTK